MENIKISLAAARVNAGLTLEQACKMLRVSKNTLIKWEKGISCPTWDKVQLISEIYKFPSDHIIFLSTQSA
jgi:transcriptional regulator with XRE-family HTH domain